MLRDTAKLHEEIVHELAFHALGAVSGLPRLAETFNSLKLLELMIANGGRWPL